MTGRPQLFTSAMSLLGRLTRSQALNVMLPNSYDIYEGPAAALAYDAVAVAFTVGLVVTGAGGATGVVQAITVDGTTGILHLVRTTGAFIDDEALTDSGSGAATVNGVMTPITGDWCKISIVEAAVFVADGVKHGTTTIVDHGTHSFPVGLEIIADFKEIQLLSGVIIAHKIT